MNLKRTVEMSKRGATILENEILNDLCARLADVAPYFNTEQSHSLFRNFARYRVREIVALMILAYVSENCGKCRKCLEGEDVYTGPCKLEEIWPSKQ